MALTDTQKTALKEVAEQVIAATRPSELILVRRLNIDKLGRRSGGMLGFDSGATAHLVLPHLITLLEALAGATAEECAKKWGKSLADWLFHGKDSQMLETASLRNVGEAFRSKLIQEGRSEEESLRISDALISTLIEHPGLVRKLVGVSK
jgi:hypothetical protein